jgi:hypothetical protein
MIVPALAVTICALAHADETTTGTVAATVAGIVIFPIAILIYEALGGGMIAAIAVIAGVFATLVAPLFARARNGVAAIVLAIVCALIALAQPAFTREKPNVIQLYYVDDPAADGPKWMTYELTEPLRKTAPFARTDAKLTPWSRGTPWAAPAPDLHLPRVTISGQRTPSGVTVRVASQRHANRVTLFVHGGTIRTINGVTPPVQPHRNSRRMIDGWQLAVGHGVEEIVVEIAVANAAGGRVEVVASDTAFSFPAAGAALLRARDESTAMTIQDGDVTLTRARASF